MEERDHEGGGPERHGTAERDTRPARVLTSEQRWPHVPLQPLGPRSRQERASGAFEGTQQSGIDLASLFHRQALELDQRQQPFSEARLFGFEAARQVERARAAESQQAPDKEDGADDRRCARDEAALGYGEDEISIQEERGTEEHPRRSRQEAEPPARTKPQNATSKMKQRHADVRGQGAGGHSLILFSHRG